MKFKYDRTFFLQVPKVEIIGYTETSSLLRETKEIKFVTTSWFGKELENFLSFYQTRLDAVKHAIEKADASF